MTVSLKLVLIGFLTGILIYIALPVFHFDESLVGFWMILWSRVSLKKASVYGVWKSLTYLTYVIGWLLLFVGILLTSINFAFLH